MKRALKSANYAYQKITAPPGFQAFLRSWRVQVNSHQKSVFTYGQFLDKVNTYLTCLKNYYGHHINDNFYDFK